MFDFSWKSKGTFFVVLAVDSSFYLFWVFTVHGCRSGWIDAREILSVPVTGTALRYAVISTSFYSAYFLGSFLHWSGGSNNGIQKLFVFILLFFLFIHGRHDVDIVHHDIHCASQFFSCLLFSFKKRRVTLKKNWVGALRMVHDACNTCIRNMRTTKRVIFLGHLWTQTGSGCYDVWVTRAPMGKRGRCLKAARKLEPLIIR